MSNAAATLRRLLQGLEELGRREDGALAGNDGLAFLALEQRAEPLVRRVVELAMSPEAMDPALRERGASLVASRGLRHQRLRGLLKTNREEINRLDEARARIQAFRPAYAAPGARTAPSFTACG